MSKIDDAIAYIQDIVLSSTDLQIKNAPDWPTDSAMIMPEVITHLSGGSASQDNATTTRILLNINTDVYLNATVIKLAYQSIDKFAFEFMRRLGGKPNLNGNVDAVVWPIEFAVSASEYNKVPAVLLSFTIPVKILTTPI
jgi:hypothetical protein